MLMQRKEVLLEQKQAKKLATPKPSNNKAAQTKSTPSKTSPSKSSNAKLSFKQKYALENLPIQIKKGEEDVAKIEAKMADGSFFVKDPDGFAKSAKALEALRDDLARWEEEWLELEMMREELEG
jgi:ATP-binding cassette subfamily F protein uup